MHFVAQGIKALNDFILQFIKIFAWDGFYFTLIFRIKILQQRDFENLLFWVNNPILQSNLMLQYVL